MNERKMPPHAAEELEAPAPRRNRRKVFMVVLLGLLLLLSGYFAPMVSGGIDLQKRLSSYDTVSVIVAKDPNDPAKQCRCLRLPDEASSVSFRLGMSMASEGPKQECGHDALLVFTGATGTFELAVSRRCEYIKYPPSPAHPFGEPRRYVSWLVEGYLMQALASGEDCDCAD